MASDGPGIGLLCFVVGRAMETRVMAAIQEAGYDDITLAQSRAFARVGADGTRVTDLAEQARITKQTAVFLVNQLEQAGYVERVVDPADARARLVRLAPRGRRLQQVARRVERQLEREWATHLGARDAAALHRILTDLREVTDPYA
ncbi:MarR family winged helix-turn-helix transcriptional regulator [Luteipulveratus halotolerans]|uniref:MarR family transcriptional regulator n=1 Tax=Luteipulveratus halotolerans TaxID=1631356 RepID=A0A0L6CIR4_9MICO|nr:MarR family transcriptional regulator [Luteipulveratus halotolerans]KNX37691.1 MarR family transcriptional regulator [Luteipulveratus halotolerans]